MSDGSDIEVLWRAARRLGRRAAVATPLPPLWFFTDPQRTPEPERVAERLPVGAGVVFRHFGAADAEGRAERLAAIARRRGLVLLIGDDPVLAETVGAAGVHLPQRRLADSPALRTRHPGWVLTGAAHDSTTLVQAGRRGLNAAFVSPVFPSESPSAAEPLGAYRLALWVHRTGLPVYALGGVTTETVVRLRGTGVAGIAAVGALAA